MTKRHRCRCPICQRPSKVVLNLTHVRDRQRATTMWKRDQSYRTVDGLYVSGGQWAYRDGRLIDHITALANVQKPEEAVLRKAKERKTS